MLKRLIRIFRVVFKIKKGGLVPAPKIHYSFRDINGGRHRRYAVSPEMLINIFTSGSIVGVDKGILPGSRFRGFTHDRHSNCLFLFVEHPMFEKTSIGLQIPEGDPITMIDLRERYSNILEESDR